MDKCKVVIVNFVVQVSALVFVQVFVQSVVSVVV